MCARGNKRGKLLTSPCSNFNPTKETHCLRMRVILTIPDVFFQIVLRISECLPENSSLNYEQDGFCPVQIGCVEAEIRNLKEDLLHRRDQTETGDKAEGTPRCLQEGDDGEVSMRGSTTTRSTGRRPPYWTMAEDRS